MVSGRLESAETKAKGMEERGGGAGEERDVHLDVPLLETALDAVEVRSVEVEALIAHN